MPVGQDQGVSHATPEQLSAAVDDVRRSPTDDGVLAMIVRRATVGARERLAVAELSPDEGVVGDSWNQRSSSRTADGAPHPDMQLNVMNWRAVSLSLIHISEPTRHG